MSRYHNILGVSTNASKAEIKKAYRKLVLKYHPDRNPSANAKQKFIEIDKAYDILMKGNPYLLLGEEIERRKKQAKARHDAAQKIKQEQRQRINEIIRKRKEREYAEYLKITRRAVIITITLITLAVGYYFISLYTYKHKVKTTLKESSKTTICQIKQADGGQHMLIDRNVETMVNVMAIFKVNNKYYKAYDYLKSTKNNGVVTHYNYLVTGNDYFTVTYHPKNPNINRIEWNQPKNNTLTKVLEKASIELVKNGHINANETDAALCIANLVYHKYGFNNIINILKNKPVKVKSNNHTLEIGYQLLYLECQE